MNYFQGSFQVASVQEVQKLICLFEWRQGGEDYRNDTYEQHRGLYSSLFQEKTPERKLQPLISAFIENSIFGNKRDPWNNTSER